MRASALLVLALAACGGATAPVVHAQQTRSPRAAPTPSRTAARAAGPCKYGMGGTLKLLDPSNGQHLDITLSSVSRSRQALADYGHAPANGYFVTIQARVVNRGAASAAIDPLDFRADAGGAHGVTVQEGNAPYSGASGQLGATPIDAGETITGPLTYDLAAANGTVTYAPRGKTACAWTF